MSKLSPRRDEAMTLLIEIGWELCRVRTLVTVQIKTGLIIIPTFTTITNNMLMPGPKLLDQAISTLISWCGNRTCMVVSGH